MHHALRKGPRFYKKHPHFSLFFQKTPPPIYFLPTALALHNLLYALTDSRLLSVLADYAKQGLGSCRASVRLFVRPFVPSFGCRSPLRRVCCCGPGGQETSIDSGGAGHPAAAAPQHGPQHGAHQQMRAVSRLQPT